ncbi:MULTISPECIES: hypothetical protein [unclassified Brachybacterium]|uniref:hypothetical protein n=1 Tax=unclassified Brachybacterium TaxID=2623841 RepID=UPI000C80FB80|nr:MULTISPECIES: hypothetical protein [unclassified Brachybacterium]PMC75149.1 hypothetical protein CJ197_09100 [Brachybacterium sp. UMB0905]
MVRRRRRLGRERLPLLERISAYHLQSNVYALLALSVLTAVSVIAYLNSQDDEGFGANLWLAIATSLMASVLVLAAETFVKFRQHENDLFLEGIEKLGISNLHFDKSALLQDLLATCSQTFWAVGYRHLLTAELRPHIEQAVERGASVRLLVVPPWAESFRLVYGDHERVVSNYLNVLRAIVDGSSGRARPDAQVRFLDRPLFNDTYKVDDVIVTGPYMHNDDRHHGKITANDFFTYELHRSSHLHELLLDEFDVLWREAELELDWERFAQTDQILRVEDLNEAGRLQLLKDSCRSLEDPAGETGEDATSQTR